MLLIQSRSSYCSKDILLNHFLGFMLSLLPIFLFLLFGGGLLSDGHLQYLSDEMHLNMRIIIRFYDFSYHFQFVLSFFQLIQQTLFAAFLLRHIHLLFLNLVDLLGAMIHLFRRWPWLTNCLGCMDLFNDRHRLDLFLPGRRRLFFRNNLPSTIESFRVNNFLCEPKVRVNSSSPLLSQVIISSIATVQIVISLEPLGKLKIILVLSPG